MGGTSETSSPPCWTFAISFMMWDHLPADVLAHATAVLRRTSDRWSARCTCKSWRAALDLHWSRECFLARLHDNPTDKASILIPSFRALHQPLWPRLRELDLVELNAQRAATLLLHLTPANFPHLTSLGLSSPLREPCADGGQLARLQLASLLELHLHDVLLKRGLRSLTHLQQLTALHICSTQQAGGGGSPPWDTQCLTSLTQLQALSLPALDQHSRHPLSLLTSLTSLTFGALGAGAVGANLLPLQSLRSLCVALHHRRETFLVMHPTVEWGALAQLHGLTALHVWNFATGRQGVQGAQGQSQVYVWADQSVAEERAQVLLAGLPALHSLRITAAYCRLERQQRRLGRSSSTRDSMEAPSRTASQPGPAQQVTAGGGEGEIDDDEAGEAVSDSRGRWWMRRESHAPVCSPGSKRREQWYHAWWQEDVQQRLQELFGQDDPSVLHYRADAYNVQGWVAMRPGNPATFNVELDYQLMQHQCQP